MTSPLTKDDWLAAGFRALAASGPQGLRAEAIARAIGTTKGSFYWHFKDLAAFKSEMLALWERKVASEIIDDVITEPDPRQRLVLLAKAAAAPVPDVYGGHAVEPAMRAWAHSDPAVLAMVKQVDTARIAFLHHLLTDVGKPSLALARAVYAAHIGLDDLTAKHGTGKSDAMSALVAIILGASAPRD